MFVVYCSYPHADLKVFIYGTSLEAGYNDYSIIFVLEIHIATYTMTISYTFLDWYKKSITASKRLSLEGPRLAGMAHPSCLQAPSKSNRHFHGEITITSRAPHELPHVTANACHHHEGDLGPDL